MNFDDQYKKQQRKVVQDIENLYDEVVNELLPTIAAVRGTEEYFRFKGSTSKKIDKLIKGLSTKIDVYIGSQCTSVWGLANQKNDSLVDKIYTERKKVAPKALKQANLKELDSFLNRKVKNLTISDRVWNLNAGYKAEIESAINAALEKGQSAESLARDIKKYLNNPDARFRKVRDKFGRLVPSKNALSYNPGPGVYRSAKQNALRLAGNEINRAYRLSEHLRFQQNPFVIGFRIQNSNRKASVCPICEYFNGTVFPKEFKFLSFHVSCRCTCIPILSKNIDGVLEGEKPESLEMPANFVSWSKKFSDKVPEVVADNLELIA